VPPLLWFMSESVHAYAGHYAPSAVVLYRLYGEHQEGFSDEVSWSKLLVNVGCSYTCRGGASGPTFAYAMDSFSPVA